MDTEDQIFGLIGAAQEHQRAMTNELAGLVQANSALQAAVAAAVPAVQRAAEQAVATALARSTRDTIASLSSSAAPIWESIRDSVQATELAQKRMGESAAVLDKAALGIDRSTDTLRRRLVVMLSAGAAGCIAAVLVAGWISLTWQRNQVSNLKEEKAALLVEVASLQATADKLAAKGGRAALTMCVIDAQKSLPCVRVNADHGSYSDKTKGLYYVLYGY